MSSISVTRIENSPILCTCYRTLMVEFLAMFWRFATQRSPRIGSRTLVLSLLLLHPRETVLLFIVKPMLASRAPRWFMEGGAIDRNRWIRYANEKARDCLESIP